MKVHLATVIDAAQTTIECSCGLVYGGTALGARRAYYRHNPDSPPLPLPVPAEFRPPSCPTAGRRWPDEREQHIVRCRSCGSQTWDGWCMTCTQAAERRKESIALNIAQTNQLLKEAS